MKIYIFIVLCCVCSCKPISLSETKPILFSQALSVGVYEYNAHRLDVEPLFTCDDLYCADITVVSPRQTEATFASIGWTGETLQSFLQHESFVMYEKGQDKFDLMVFFFQSRGVDYMRVVNIFNQAVDTKALQVGQKITLQALLESQQLLYVHSLPTLADIYMDDRNIGEAPLWIWLGQGSYELVCKLPGEQSKVTTMEVPGQVVRPCKITR